MIIKHFKAKFIGLIAILCIILFTYSIIGIVERANQREIEKLEEVITLSDKREDASKTREVEMSINITNLIIESNKQNSLLNMFQQDYTNDKKELKQLKNEKNHIPLNVTIDDQYIFISGYKYQRY